MAGTTLGIMITKYANLEHIAGVTQAARNAGYPVAIFMTDEGVKFTKDVAFMELLKTEGVKVTVCEYMCELLGIPERTEGICYGSQYDNAGMLHNSDRVLVF